MHIVISRHTITD